MNKSITLLRDIMDAIHLYESQAGCAEMNEKGTGNVYNKRVVLEVHDKMLKSIMQDLKVLHEDGDADLIYAGFYFRFKKKEDDRP
jgi:aconitase B